MNNISYITCKKLIQKRYRHKYSLFTLIEILVVVGIMLLLMAIMMPAFDSLASSGGLRAGSREFCQTLKLARIYAVNNREYVAVVMPLVDKMYNNPDISSDGNDHAFPEQSESGIEDQYYNRAYRACVIYVDNNGDKVFKHWIPGEKWRMLPTGVCFVAESQPSVSKPGLTHKALKVKNVDYSEIGGIKPSDTDDIRTVAMLFTPAGRAGSHERFFVILGEGVYTDGRMVYTNFSPPEMMTDKDIGSDTWVAVSINKFGQIAYVGTP